MMTPSSVSPAVSSIFSWVPFSTLFNPREFKNFHLNIICVSERCRTYTVKASKRFLSFYIRWFGLSLVYFQVQNFQTNYWFYFWRPRFMSRLYWLVSIWYRSGKSLVTDLLERINHEALYFIISKDGKSGDSKSKWRHRLWLISMMSSWRHLKWV